MNDPWQQVLESLEPEYEKLKSAMETGPRIKPTLYQSNSKKWRVTLEEDWPDNPVVFESHNLDFYVDWTDKELSKWSNVRRISWDSWDFSTKRDAERFVIIYNLTWSQ